MKTPSDPCGCGTCGPCAETRTAFSGGAFRSSGETSGRTLSGAGSTSTASRSTQPKIQARTPALSASNPSGQRLFKGESDRLSLPYQLVPSLIVPQPGIVPITQPQPGCRPPSTGFGGECRTANLPEPPIDEATRFVWQGNYWVPVREAETLPWVAMDLDGTHLNMTGRQAGDQATGPTPAGAIVPADYARAIPVWSSSSAWRAVQGQPGKLEAIRGCRRRYSMRYGDNGRGADGVPITSPAASVDLLVFRLGDVVRRLYGFYQQFNSPAARAMLDNVQLSIGDNQLGPDRRRYDFVLGNDTYLEVSVSLSFGRTTVPNRPDLAGGTNFAPLNVDGVFAGAGSLSIEYTDPGDPMNSPVRINPRATSVAMVGGGNPQSFGNGPNIPLPPLMSNGDVSFVTTGVFDSNPSAHHPASANLGFEPANRPPGVGLIREFRALDISREDLHFLPAGVDRERAFSDRLIDLNKRAARSHCKRLRFSIRIGRPPFLAAVGQPECDLQTIKLANETRLAFSPEDVAGAQRAGIDIREHVFSRSPGINTSIGTGSDTLFPLCGAEGLQAVMIGIFSDVANCPSVIQLGQAPQWPALRVKLDCVHARLVQQ